MSEVNKKLCLQLVRAESEEDVVYFLSKAGYWNNPSCWKYYGGSESNFSSIGNQQSSADAALVEKIINSVDAVLMRECLEKNIDPEGKNAPRNIEEALYKFFGIYKGRLANIDSKIRAQLAKNIFLLATGDKNSPNYSVIDKGEGQSPDDFPKTFLSLNRSNKIRIPFVQGKFNMGATGSFQFCGNRNIQLIISRRDPHIIFGKNPGDSTYWGFTVTRRENPSAGMKSSVFKYLAPDDAVLKFEADSLALLPDSTQTPYAEPLEYGSFVKLFNYNFEAQALKTNILFDLNYKLSLLLPNIALPVTLSETRNYKGHTLSSTLSGLSVRLDEDKSENIELGFPGSSEISVMGEKMGVLIYVFKKDREEKYSPKDGVIFTVNGQAHGFLPRSFFERGNVGMQYLKKSILLIVDCTALGGRTKEDLFMNSRDRLREGPVKAELERELEQLVNNHVGLRDLRERRRREEMQNIIGDSRPLKTVIGQIFKKSPTLTKLFIRGQEIVNPFDLLNKGVSRRFIGKKFPTFFSLEKEFPENRPKECHINRRFRIQFNTDVENSYFERDVDPGEFALNACDNEVKDFSMNLWNGNGTLNVTLPEDSKIGEILCYNYSIKDYTLVEPFKGNIYIKVIEEDRTVPGGKGRRRTPRGNEEGESDMPSGLSLPNIIECRKTDKNYRFAGDEKGALDVVDNGEGGYDFFINIDNEYLNSEIKYKNSIDPELQRSRFKFAQVLVGLGCLDLYKRSVEKEDGQESIHDKIYFFTKSISPMLLPMISELGSLENIS